jgi:Fe-S cluster assembly protein SufD
MIVQSGFERDTFKALLGEYLSQINTDDALRKLRGSAWNHFLDLGWPSKETEVYRYVKLNRLFSSEYRPAEKVEASLEDVAPFVQPECCRSVLVFINGHFCPGLSNAEALPSRVSISTLSDAMQTYGTFLHNHWGKSLKGETDAFAALNGALHQDGLFIYVPPKTVVDVPVQILHLIQGPKYALSMLMPRVNVFVGSQSQINLVGSQKSTTSSRYFVNNVIEVALEEGAHVRYTQTLCEEGVEAWHLDAFRATLKRDAKLETVLVTEGGMTVRNDYRIALDGENAEAILNGVWMLSGKREYHANVLMEHRAPHCRSRQFFKGVLDGFSRSSFEGKIMVRQEAQKTEAFQMNNNLILSDHAHAACKPNLEIFADDVKASHGATVGQLDLEQLFYMKTRGFSDEEAKNMLIYGFCGQIIDTIEVPSLKETISSRARRYLTAGKP